MRIKIIKRHSCIVQNNIRTIQLPTLVLIRELKINEKNCKNINQYEKENVLNAKVENLTVKTS